MIETGWKNALMINKMRYLKSPPTKNILKSPTEKHVALQVSSLGFVSFLSLFFRFSLDQRVHEIII